MTLKRMTLKERRRRKALLNGRQELYVSGDLTITLTRSRGAFRVLMIGAGLTNWNNKMSFHTLKSADLFINRHIRTAAINAAVKALGID